MAKAVVFRDACENGLLPAVCVKCGRPAVSVHNQTWMRVPFWVVLIMPLDWSLSYFITNIIIRRRARLPFCPKHHHHWRKWLLILLFGVVLCLFPWFAFFALALFYHPAPRTIGPAVPMFFVAMYTTPVSMICMPVLVSFVRSKIVRIEAVDNDTIRFNNVSDEFAQAVKVSPFGDDWEYAG